MIIIFECYDDLETFVSERVTKLRTEKGVSARDMSLSIGQNTGYINHIENKSNMPSLKGLFYICEYFNISPQQFFDDNIENPLLLNGIGTLTDEDLKMLLRIIDRLKNEKKA